jgi:hypothetical protein
MADFFFVPDPDIRRHQTQTIRKELNVSLFEADSLWIEERKRLLLDKAVKLNLSGRPQDAINCIIEAMRLKKAAVG